MAKQPVPETLQDRCQQLITESTNITELIKNYEMFAKEIQNEVDPGQLAILKATYIKDALEKQYTEELSDPSHKLSIYMVKQLLQDNSLLKSINSIPNVDVTIDKLCNAIVMTANDLNEVVERYPLIATAIDNSDLPQKQKADMKESYISILLPNTIQSVENGNLKKRSQQILKFINNSSMEQDTKSDLLTRFKTQYSTYSSHQVSAQSVFLEKLQSQTTSGGLNEYLLAQKKAKHTLDEQEKDLDEDQSHGIQFKDR